MDLALSAVFPYMPIVSLCHFLEIFVILQIAFDHENEAIFRSIDITLVPDRPHGTAHSHISWRML